MSRTLEFFSPNHSTAYRSRKTNNNYFSHGDNLYPSSNQVSSNKSVSYLSSLQQKPSHQGSQKSSKDPWKNKRKHLNSKSEKVKTLTSTSACSYPITKQRPLTNTYSTPVLSKKHYFLRGSTHQPLKKFQNDIQNLASGEHIEVSKKYFHPKIVEKSNSCNLNQSDLESSAYIDIDYSLDQSNKHEPLTYETNDQIIKKSARDQGEIQIYDKNVERSAFIVFHVIHLIASYFASTIWELGKLILIVISKPFVLVWWMFCSVLKFTKWCKSLFKMIGFLFFIAVVCFFLHYGFLNFEKRVSKFQKLFAVKNLHKDLFEDIHTDEVFKHNLQKLEVSLEEIELSFADRHATVLKIINSMQKKYENDQSNAIESQKKMLSTVELSLSKTITEQILRNNEVFQIKLEDIQSELNNLYANHSHMVNLLHKEIYEKVELSRDVHRPLVAKLQEFEQKLQKLDSTLEHLNIDHNEFKKSVNQQYGNVTFLRELSNEQFIENFLKLLQKGASTNVDTGNYNQKVQENRRHKLLSVIFLEWLQKRGFVSENTIKKLQNELAKKFSTVQNNLKESLEKNILDFKKVSFQPGLTLDSTLQQPYSTKLTENLIKMWINEALSLYSADRIGTPDYALESAGAAVVESRCSPSIQHQSTLVSFLGIPIYYNVNSPRSLIQPGVMPGECWAFESSKGYAVIALSSTIRPTSVTIDHIPKSIALFDNISSAPKDFSVYGLKYATDIDGVLLGVFRFEESGGAIQQFSLDDVGDSFNHVELRIESNWGHPDFTCVYRFRVHGQRVIV